MGMCCIICQKNGLFRLKNKWNGLFSLALVIIVDIWYGNFRAFRSKWENREYLERYYLFSEYIPPRWTVPFEFSPELPKFHSNGKRSKALTCGDTSHFMSKLSVHLITKMEKRVKVSLYQKQNKAEKYSPLNFRWLSLSSGLLRSKWIRLTITQMEFWSKIHLLPGHWYVLHTFLLHIKILIKS